MGETLLQVSGGVPAGSDPSLKRSQQGAIRRLVGPGPRFPTCTMKGWAKWSPGRFLKANGRPGGKGAFYRLGGLHPALQEGNRVGWGWGSSL